MTLYEARLRKAVANLLPEQAEQVVSEVMTARKREASLREAAAYLPPEQALHIVHELVDLVLNLLTDLPPFRSKETVEFLLSQVFNAGEVADRTELRPRLCLVVSNEEAHT
jgi:hypothetical protein